MMYIPKSIRTSRDRKYSVRHVVIGIVISDYSHQSSTIGTYTLLTYLVWKRKIEIYAQLIIKRPKITIIEPYELNIFESFNIFIY